MRRLGRLVVLALMTVGLMAPGLAGTASAQDAEGLCAEADGAESGKKIGRYTVVYGSGGAGSQIVLGYGSGYLSGGSGNDVLCAWGGGNTLDGGSGNDVLVVMSGAGNTLLGGSGNDTMIGLTGDAFDGGSGRNVTDIPVLALFQDLWISGGFQGRDGVVSGTGFTPNSGVLISVDRYSSAGRARASVGYIGTDEVGSFSSNILLDGYRIDYVLLCGEVNGARTTTLTVTVTNLEGVAFSETFDSYCLQP